MTGFFVETLYGVETRQGLVQITVTNSEDKEVVVQCSQQEALDLAENLVSAAFIAQSDQVLLSFLGDTAGVTEPSRIAVALRAFRKYRSEIMEADV